VCGVMTVDKIRQNDMIERTGIWVRQNAEKTKS